MTGVLPRFGVDPMLMALQSSAQLGARGDAMMDAAARRQVAESEFRTADLDRRAKSFDNIVSNAEGLAGVGGGTLPLSAILNGVDPTSGVQLTEQGRENVSGYADVADRNRQMGTFASALADAANGIGGLVTDAGIRTDLNEVLAGSLPLGTSREPRDAELALQAARSRGGGGGSSGGSGKLRFHGDTWRVIGADGTLYGEGSNRGEAQISATDNGYGGLPSTVSQFAIVSRGDSLGMMPMSDLGAAVSGEVASPPSPSNTGYTFTPQPGGLVRVRTPTGAMHDLSPEHAEELRAELNQ